MKSTLAVIMALATFHSFGFAEEKKVVAASDIGDKLVSCALSPFKKMPR
jgi:hypothetical protein